MDFTPIIQAFLQNGLLGACVLVLAYSYWQKDKRLADIWEKRLEEARESLTALNANTAATKAQTEAFNLLASVIQRQLLK